MRTNRRYSILAACVVVCGLWAATAQAVVTQVVITSDHHYDGSSGVQITNQAVLADIKALPTVALPGGGLVGDIDFVAVTGDICQRASSVGSMANVSWGQFYSDYLDPASPYLGTGGLNVPVYATAGNHDVSNALGAPKINDAYRDPTTMVQLNNLMRGTSMTNESYSYSSGDLNYSKDIGGVHMMFVNMWPDANVRAWMTTDLQTVGENTPVLLFTHDPVSGDGAHITDGMVVDIDVTAFDSLLDDNPNIVTYFHGHRHSNSFYAHGDLKVSQVGSTRYNNSFQLATIDTDLHEMTVREYRASSDTWGASMVVALPVPEPTSMLLLLTAVVPVILRSRRRA